MAKHIINNPGGRKTLPEDEKYGTPIPVRFTKKQFLRIKRKAGEMPISTYIRAHQYGFNSIADKANEALNSVNAILHQARLKIAEKEVEDTSFNG
mgnify:CR=1 FL=1